MAWPTLLDCRLRELLAHWQIITESESIKEPRGRSHSQSYSQIALLHSHLFLHDQLTFADISGTDTTGSQNPAAFKSLLDFQQARKRFYHSWTPKRTTVQRLSQKRCGKGGLDLYTCA